MKHRYIYPASGQEKSLLLPLILSFQGLLLLTVFMMERIDIPAVLYFYQIGLNQSRYLSILSDLANGRIVIPALFLSSLIAWWVSRDKKVWRQTLFVAATIALSGIMNTFLKFICGRYRPQLLFSNSQYGFGFFETQHLCVSFPSGHANTAAAIVVSLSFFYPRLAPILIPVGFAIAFCRALICTHYMSDIVWGYYVALWTALLLRKLCQDKGVYFA